MSGGQTLYKTLSFFCQFAFRLLKTVVTGHLWVKDCISRKKLFANSTDDAEMLRNICCCHRLDPAAHKRENPQRSGYSLDSSLWISSAKLGSSPHQKSQSSLRPRVWCLLQTLSTSAAMHRLKLHRMGSSSVTGKRMGEEVGPCHTKRLHFIPVKSACGRQERIFVN